MTKNGISSNPVVFRPRKMYVNMHFYKIKEEDFSEKLDAAGLSYDYFNRRGELRIRINEFKEYSVNKELIDGIAQCSVDNKS